MNREYRIGVDIGTTSTKAVLYGDDGSPLATAHEAYPLHAPVPDAAEQDPEQILHAVVETIRTVVSQVGANPSQVGFAAFSSAMHSVIAVDADCRPLTPCITWADNRSAPWAQRLRADGSGHDIYMRTGTPIHPMSPLTKLMWLRNGNAEAFRQAAKFVSIKEYVFARLFGPFVVDHSIASATGLMNLQRLDWDEEALRAAGVERERLSTLVPTTHALRGLRREFAERMGLTAETPFIVGASDGVLSNLGVGAGQPGVVAATIGTSGAIRTVVDRPVTDPAGRTFCYALADGKWVIGGAVNNGGMLLRWVKEELAAAEAAEAERQGADPYDRLIALADGIAPGADGLIFHPYLTGERAPLWNPDARGSFFGLTMRHGKPHLIRAVMEGVLYNLYSVLLAMEAHVGRPSRIHATGGFSRSPIWRQMMADIFGVEVVFPESYESSCLGAVALGLYATGRIDSLDAAAGMVGSTLTHRPDVGRAEVYRQVLPIYLDVADKLGSAYAAIAGFQRQHGKRD